MARSTNSNGKRPISSESIHEAVDAWIDNDDNATTTAAVPPDALENALQALNAKPRPETSDDVKEYCRIVSAAANSCGDDVQSWRLFVLTILRKRYHAKAPEAKALGAVDKTKDSSSASASSSSYGQGERLSFYVSVLVLYVLGNNNKESTTANLASRACECLCGLAYDAGGSRDSCALAEHVFWRSSRDAGLLKARAEDGNRKALAEAVSRFVVATDDKLPSALTQSLRKIVALLDEDAEIVARGYESRATKKIKVDSEEEERKFQSTVNTFLPHRDRGVGDRRLVQTVLELMIWNRTSQAKEDVKFRTAMTKLANDGNDDPEKFLATVYCLQTSTRRFRQSLNASARAQGFSLSASYPQHKPLLKQVRVGKEGDLSELTRLATKRNDREVLKLLSKRYEDPDKAVPIRSVRAFYNEWSAAQETTEEDDPELTELALRIREAVVRATVENLRKSCRPNDRTTVLASLDASPENDGAAILVAAALNSDCKWDDSTVANDEKEGEEDTMEEVGDRKKESPTVRLFIGEQERDVSTPSNVMDLLNEVFTREKETTPDYHAPDQRIATTKAVQNLIERHVLRNDSVDGTATTNTDLLLFAAADVKLEQRVLSLLVENDHGVHCHVNDEWSRRMEREKAKVGDVTVTLAWDNECDLDLHVFCPNGDHVFYSNKQGGGGYLDVDMNAGGPYSTEPVENVFFGDAEKGVEATRGRYKVVVQNFAYHGTTVESGNPVPWRVRVVENDVARTYSGECVGSGSESDVTAVEFEYKGRTAPAPEAVGSALESSKLVAVTSSVGDTLDSLRDLVTLSQQRQQLEQVRELVTMEEDEAKEEVKEDKEQASTTTSRPLMSNAFDVTNRDRLYLNLSNLPVSFHTKVNMAFASLGSGPVSLAEHTASVLAKRLVQDNIHVGELTRAGYQDDIVELVRKKMTTFGL